MAPPKRKIAENADDHRKAKQLRQQIDEDDAVIRDLEKKLGIKKNRKSVPKAFKDDGLEDLFGADFDKSGDEGEEESKQKSEYEAFLAEKRAKAGGVQAFAPKSRHTAVAEEEDDEEDDGFAGFSDDDDNGDEDDLAGNEDGEDFEGDDDDELDGLKGLADDDDELDSDNFDDEEEEEEEEEKEEEDDGTDNEDDNEPETPKVRENPYVAPTTGRVVGKYIPPSLRKAAMDVSEQEIRLQRQLNGYLNKLSESNMMGILKDVEKIYADHARGDANNALIDALMSQVCNPATLPDTFYILTAGFSAAVYKVIGESFGSQLVTKVVELFQKEYETAKNIEGQASKATSNLLTFMSELYVFQVVGCNMVFDFVRLLLEDITELSTELILRIVRMAGKYLRKDDPQSLKDLVNVLGSPAAANTNKEISVRTKFMIETITDLKNNKLKTGVQESTVVADYAARMRRILGAMNQRRLAANGPMRFGLRDIALAETKGKWWITGSSYQDPRKAEAAQKAAASIESSKRTVQPALEDGYASTDSEDYEFWLPENKLRRLALDMGLKKEVQQSIMISIAGAANLNDAVLHFRKLNLNKTHRTEVALVLLTCASGEHPYNSFYAAVANKLSSDGRIRYAFKSQLLSVFRRLGESLFDEEENSDDDAIGLEEERLENIGQFVGSLIVDGSMSLQALKAIDFPTMQKKSSVLVKSILKSVLSEAIKAGKVKDHHGVKRGPEVTILKVLKDVEATSMSGGLQFMFAKLLKSGDLSKSEKETCKMARTVLEQQNM